MKAIVFHEFGTPDVLKYEDVPDPQLRNQVLVRVRACALNHLDLWVRKGLPGVKLPHINGSDVAGEVAEVGEYVSGCKAGQRVLLAPMVFCNHCRMCGAGQQNLCRQFTVLGNGVDGGNCELIAIPEVNVIPIPDHLSFEQAAAVPLVFLTAWHMLVSRCGIRPGMTVLVLAGGSGVGSAAIQIAKLFHCNVIATAGDERKLERSRQLGADHVIDHYRQKISDEVKRITGKQMCDIAFEHVGAATFEESIRSLKPGGCLVTCGATSGPEAEFDLRVLFAKQLSFLGSYMGTMGDLHGVLQHVFAGRLQPVIDTTFPLREAAAAHRHLENKEQFGKVVLTVP
jgi:NADPH:quinone reductase-like Zn-dependent oxidoreductase